MTARLPNWITRCCWIAKFTGCITSRACRPGAAGHYIELVVSATRAFAALPREEAIRAGARELAEFFPRVKEAKLEKVALVKEVRATFGVPPGIDAARPAAVSPWPNCFLAGDWTATGWPSTMESAARSGHLGSRGTLPEIGEPRTFLDPDLKPEGMMRWMRAGKREQGTGNREQGMGNRE